MSLSESAVQTRIRIRAGELGIPLFRNNSGACEDVTGRLIRYGLANDSAQMNKRLKSGDLIGLLVRERWDGVEPPYKGERRMIRTGVFLSVECKKEDWQGGYPTEPDPSRFNEREQAQQNWIDLVRRNGGIAGFARCVEEFESLIHGRTR